MYVGLTLSVLAHMALLGWALISFQATPPLKISEPEPVEVALISADELVRLTKGDRSSKQLKTQASPQTDDNPVKQEVKLPAVKTVPPPAAAEPPPEQVDDISKRLASLEPVPPKPVGPTPEELAAQKAAEEKLKAEKAEAELALKKQAEEEARQAAEEEKKRKADKEAEKKRKQAEAEKQRKAEAARRKKQEEARKKKLAEKRARELAEQRRREAKKFDPGKISALLNKIPDAQAPAAGSPDPNTNRDLPKGAQAGAPEGRDTQLTASQRSLLGAIMKREVSRCWNINSGLAGIDRIVVDIEVKLSPNGRINGQPKVVSSGRGPIFQDAANNAMRALIQCEPYNLPQQFYKGGWDHMVVTFDPQKMF
ncbi:MAG: cell envelope integrity protein TolA [Alphaproteobacteria bacterium]|nr:cell envelope integrity protein TolA [Alphaproteobacteria bacterium]